MLKITGQSGRKKEIGLRPMTKNPYTNRKFENQWTTQNATKIFEYTTSADRLRTVRWSNNSHPTGVVKPVYGYQTFPLTTKAVLSKGQTFKICK